jgi:hypothetical protein
MTEMVCPHVQIILLRIEIDDDQLVPVQTLRALAGDVKILCGDSMGSGAFGRSFPVNWGLPMNAVQQLGKGHSLPSGSRRTGGCLEGDASMDGRSAHWFRLNRNCSIH